METLEATQRDIAYRKYTLRFQEQQTEILRQQTKILESQQAFTKILAVATCILAMGVIFQVYFYVLFEGIQGTKNLILLLPLGIIIVGLLIYSAYLMANAIKPIKKKK